MPLFACTIDLPQPGEPDRGGIDKDDLFGSCVQGDTDACGGQSAGNCWCDERCVDYGDCCSDVGEVCGGDPPVGRPCGGLLGLTCDDGEFCNYAPEAICGAADATGECTPIPEACILIYDPVCGCDDRTYGNACEAASAGVSVLHDGECDRPAFCGGIAGFPCAPGEMCVDDPSDDCDPNAGGADCGGICVPEAVPCPMVLCAQECVDGYVFDANGCQTCECVETHDTCGPIENDFVDELAEIQACQQDAECGQVLMGTSCGCTRNRVARIDADLADFNEIVNKARLNECSLPGTISTCDCPAADGFRCTDGVCGWNYL